MKNKLIGIPSGKEEINGENMKKETIFLPIIALFLLFSGCINQENNKADGNEDLAGNPPIVAYGEIYTVTFNDSVFNFSECIDDFDRIITEKEITREVTFTNYDDTIHRIYIKLTIPDHLKPYSTIYVLLKSDTVTYLWGITEERWIPVKANSDTTLVLIYRLERSPIGTVIDNYTYKCYLRCSIECNYNVDYWDESILFKVRT